MITLERPAYFSNERYAEYYGLSTDDKGTVQANNADKFYEIDTGKTYRYNETSGEWIEQPESTTAVDTGLPPITSETSGHFLSNDGSVTHWQTIASQDFIIGLTDNQDGTYTADKTYVEIKAAYDAKMNIEINIGGTAILPLMVAEVVNGEASFIFGYTRVSVDGQLVHTRAVEYAHSDSTDTWTDIDEVGDYVKTSDVNKMVTKQSFHQEPNTAHTYTLVDGVYVLVACDAGHSGVATVNISGNSFVVSHVSTLSSWTATKGAVSNSIYINNLSPSAALDVYVLAL